MSTLIQWTDVTDNIIVVKGGGWWCRKISPGCANCYAAKLNQNAWYGGNKLAYSGPVPELELREDVLSGWARMRKAKRHFVASMTDIFGDWVPSTWAFRFLDAMRMAPRQTFQLLTKRPDVARSYIGGWLAFHGLSMLPANIQIGTSVEDQPNLNLRVKELIQIPAHVRFLSVEPMLGPVTFKANHLFSWDDVEPTGAFRTNPADGKRQLGVKIKKGAKPLLHWVIVGGESGSKARKCEVQWVRSIVQQCKSAGVPCFVKQLGSYIVDRNDAGFEGDDGDWPMDTQVKELDSGYQGAPVRVLTSHKKGGEMDEWPEALRIRQFPQAQFLVSSSKLQVEEGKETHG